jgi:hypothetical protein
MTANGWSQIIFFVLVIFLITKPMESSWRRYSIAKRLSLIRYCAISKLLYRLTGIDERLRVLELNLDLDVKYPLR